MTDPLAALTEHWPTRDSFDDDICGNDRQPWPCPTMADLARKAAAWEEEARLQTENRDYWHRKWAECAGATEEEK